MNLWRSFSLIPIPRQGHLEQATQERIQVGFECHWGGRCHDLPWQPVPVLCHAQCKDALPHVEVKFLMFYFIGIVPCPIVWHHWKESGTVFLTVAFEILALHKSSQPLLHKPWAPGHSWILWVFPDWRNPPEHCTRALKCSTAYCAGMRNAYLPSCQVLFKHHINKIVK